MPEQKEEDIRSYGLVLIAGVALFTAVIWIAVSLMRS